MLNPIALVMLVLGVLLLLFGLSLLVRRGKIAGILVSLLGLALSVTPFLVSYYLAR